MATKERAADRGARRGRELTAGIARELHAARVDRGLSLRVVGAACGISASEASRIERGIVSASIIRLAQLAAVVGLDLSVRLYPGGSPVRDSAQLAILARPAVLRACPRAGL